MITNLVTFSRQYCHVFTHVNRTMGDLCRLSDPMENQLDDLGIIWSYWDFRENNAVIRIDNDDDLSVLILSYPLIPVAKSTFIDVCKVPVDH